MTREEAVYRLKNTAWLGSDADRSETEKAVQMAIEALQEQKTGKWIAENDIADGRYRCSNCNYIRDAYHLVIGDYCPNCGTRMEREEE